MPSKLGCQSCAHEFEVGWFHYHILDTGYGAKTLLVCGACGLPHAVDIALRSRGPEVIQHFVANLIAVPAAARLLVMARLRSKANLDLKAAKEVLNRLPYQLGTDLSEYAGQALVDEYSSMGAVVELAVVRESRNPNHGPIQRDRLLARDAALSDEEKSPWREISVLGPRSGDAGEFELALQACGGCGRVGELVSSWPADRPCPACGGHLEERGSWIT